MRALAISLAAAAACGQAEAPATPHPAAAPPVADVAPGLRLPDGVTPIGYALTLELDPERAEFAGHVVITLAISRPIERLWLHAVELELRRARLVAAAGDVPLPVSRGPAGSQRVALELPAPARGPTLVVALDYTGLVGDQTVHLGKDEEGLFRERSDGRWYLYSQAESIFARKIVPCLDEPRWKPTWQLTVIAPRGQLVLGNAPVASERALADGRREVRFAEIAALPSYLLAVAVGPFDLVEVGRLGRGRLPTRIAVARGDAARLAPARRALPPVVDALERYLDAPLPLAKLDLVAVPRFFGAMENPGLILFDAAILVGGHELVPVLAHELAHQWFGDAVTPAWWDHLWLSEALASWLDQRISAGLGAGRGAVAAHDARVRALEADDDVAAQALVHPIERFADIEPAFDAIAYEKGAAVIAMFEQFAGDAAWQAAVRGYLRAHAGASVTSQAMLDAVRAAAGPEVAAALGSQLAHVGVPVVELAVRCAPAPVIVAIAQAGVTVPVCARYPAGRACWLVAGRAEHALPATAACPAWLVGNAGGRGYYRTIVRDPGLRAPIAALSADERLARGDDAALALRHGELSVDAGLGELAVLAAAAEPYAALAALAIARAIDPLVDDATRPAWESWLAARFADRLTAAALAWPRSPVDVVARGELLALVADRIAPSTAAAVRAALARQPARTVEPLLEVAVAADREAVFAGAVAAARLATDPRPELGVDPGELLAAMPAAYAPRIAGLIRDPRWPAARLWPVLAALLERGATRGAAWRAIVGELEPLLGEPAGERLRALLAAATGLCDAGDRAALVAVVGPRRAALGEPDGPRALDRALAAIDRCLARRAAAGPLDARLTRR